MALQCFTRQAGRKINILNDIKLNIHKICRLTLVSKHAFTYEGQNQPAIIALFDVSTSTGKLIYFKYLLQF